MPKLSELRGPVLYDALMALKPADLAETAWAVMAGVNRGFFSDLKNKETSPRSDTLEKVLAAIGKTVSDLTGDPSSNARPFQMEGASMERLSRDVPIYGTALGADQIVDGEAIEQTMLNTAEVVGYLKRPALLEGRKDVYGLYVQGSSMHPRHKDGDVLYAEGKRVPSIGEDAVVYLRSPDEHEGERADAVLVKTVVRKSASYVELEQYNPHKVFRIPVERIQRMDRVIPWPELVS